MKVQEVLTAQKRLKHIIHMTSLDYSNTFSEISNNDIYLKLENLQKTGSFKIRGAYNKIMSLNAEELSRGVVAASAGNHAQGVAYGARAAGVKATIIMPESVPLAKAQATKGYGAEVILAGNNYDEAYEKARELQEEMGATFIHAFDDSAVIAGQGTIGLEILEQLPDVDAVLVPIGGGGLISGVACAIKEHNPKVKIIGVEASGAAAFYESRKTSQKVKLDSVHTIADGIAVKEPGRLTFDLVQQYVDDIVTVSDEEIASSILFLLERAKLMVEGAGAVGIAALMHDRCNMRNKKIVSILSGGNIDVNLISKIIDKGLAQRGRITRLVALIDDKPGALKGFLDMLSNSKANIISINHDRLSAEIPVHQAAVEIAMETHSNEHIWEIIEQLNRKGYQVRMG